jgi:hypothetical protein
MAWGSRYLGVSSTAITANRRFVVLPNGRMVDTKEQGVPEGRSNQLRTHTSRKHEGWLSIASSFLEGVDLTGHGQTHLHLVCNQFNAMVERFPES